jgi:hypothetical protein
MLNTAKEFIHETTPDGMKQLHGEASPNWKQGQRLGGIGAGVQGVYLQLSTPRYGL